MLKHAQDNKYAVPAFNFDNLEMLKGIIMAAQQENSPVIIMATASAINFMGLEYTLAIANTAINNSTVPVVLHLDHCFDSHFIKTKVTTAFGSVMLDWSKYPLKENIEKTKEIVQFASPLGIAVEAEIGHVGGKEDDMNSDTNIYTNIDEAILFRNKTNINALAISVGTQHGQYKAKPILQIDLIKQIANKMPEIPLVLHGASGVDDEQLALAINAGICKVNMGTDLKIAYVQSLKESFKKDPTLFDARIFGQNAIDAVQVVAQRKIIACNANNKAK